MWVRRWLGVTSALVAMAGGQVLLVPSSGGAAEPDRDVAGASMPSLSLAGPANAPEASRRLAVRTPAGRPIARPAEIARTASPAVAARTYIKRYAERFQLAEQARNTRVARVTSVGTGHGVRVQQLTLGLPVIGGELVVTTDAANNLVSITGETSASVPRSATPAVSAADAVARAVDRVARSEQVSPSSLQGSAAVLSVYDASLLGAGSSVARLVWRIEVGNGSDVRHFTLVDAHRGVVVLDFSMIAEAKELHVCDKANVRSAFDACIGAGHRSFVDDVDSGALVPGSDPGRAAEVNAAFDHSFDFYDFLLAQTGRDSVDGAGMPLRTTVRYCTDDTDYECPLNNAYWNGSQVVFGEGYSFADDVVAHELAHGLTQHTSGLFYYSQSGAINESLSDVFGELLDQQVDRANTDEGTTNWLVGEDLTDGALRGHGESRDLLVQGPQPDSMSSRMVRRGRGRSTDNGASTPTAGSATRRRS